MQHHDGVSPAWPLSYAELEPYYTQAEQLYQVHGERGGEDDDDIGLETLGRAVHLGNDARDGGSAAFAPEVANAGGRLPPRFWLYAAATLLYGVVETLNGNWATVYLAPERQVSAQDASFTLTAFWVMVRWVA
jgi:choline dehydrogenase-like flavoprotein